MLITLCSREYGSRWRLRRGVARLRAEFSLGLRPQGMVKRRVNLEILAPLELTKGELISVAKESMSQKKISSGVVHEVPGDFKKALTSDPQALTAWEDITPLARNEWICWIESAKKAETRSRRIEWGCSSLKDGKRRPCCWPGCAHR